MAQTAIGIEVSELIRDEHGHVTLPQPQTADDVEAAIAAALTATTAAYRAAYTHAEGDLDDDTVDGLDLAVNALIDVLG